MCIHLICMQHSGEFNKFNIAHFIYVYNIIVIITIWNVYVIIYICTMGLFLIIEFYVATV